jgi:hypothetical protein
MALYVAESYDFTVFHDGRYSEGVVGKGGGSEKIYLHVLDVSEGDVARLGPREDEHGNKQHDRRALPNNEEWWIAVEGDKTWPKTVRPAVVSHCALDDGKPVPQPLSEPELAALRKVGASLP